MTNLFFLALTILIGIFICVKHTIMYPKNVMSAKYFYMYYLSVIFVFQVFFVVVLDSEKLLPFLETDYIVAGSLCLTMIGVNRLIWLIDKMGTAAADFYRLEENPTKAAFWSNLVSYGRGFSKELKIIYGILIILGIYIVWRLIKVSMSSKA